MNYELLKPADGALIKSWTKGVPFEDSAKRQVITTAQMPFIYKWLALMPDVHGGRGSTIGTVIPTDKAIIPAAVGVDIGCGMMAVKTKLNAHDLPDSLKNIRSRIESSIPHGRSDNGGAGDVGAWGVKDHAANIERAWLEHLSSGFRKITNKHPVILKCNSVRHLGTLGTGNHFIEICLDENNDVWVMLHSGSRGVGNRIGSYFIEIAKEEMRRYYINLPDKDLSYLVEGSQYFDDYVEAVNWAQEYARINRELMMRRTLVDLYIECKPYCFDVSEIVNMGMMDAAINCHHNYVQKENHYGKNIWITRKGAVSAREGQLGIIPGSMGAKSFIVRGLGNKESFNSCSHGAGRVMSRTDARKKFTVEDHEKATKGVECRKDESVLDETPAAYKDIDAVMKAQSDLVEVVHTLRQVVCVKG